LERIAHTVYVPRMDGKRGNAIRLLVEGQREPVEISELLPRLKTLTVEPERTVRYYIPKELHADALKLRRGWRG
jgi:hypothetical protein